VSESFSFSQQVRVLGQSLREEKQYLIPDFGAFGAQLAAAFDGVVIRRGLVRCGAGRVWRNPGPRVRQPPVLAIAEDPKRTPLQPGTGMA
jgi:hypothetical protein